MSVSYQISLSILRNTHRLDYSLLASSRPVTDKTLSRLYEEVFFICDLLKIESLSPFQQGKEASTFAYLCSSSLFEL